MKDLFIILTAGIAAYFIPGARAADEQLSLTVGKSLVIDSATEVERVAVATEDVVEAVAVTDKEVVLNGKGPGETSVIIWHRNGGGRQAYNVTVTPSPAKIEALRRLLKSEIGESIEVEQSDKNVVLHGSIRNPAEGERAVLLAAMLGKPVSLLTMATPAAPPQILLKVRFADVDRSASLSFGANIFSTGAANTSGSVTTQQFSPPTPNTFNNTTSQFNLSNALNLFLFRPQLDLGATIEALRAKNLVQILAEPNVLAVAGKEASFLAGGEFPYPVIQNSSNGINNVTIQFREFGIRLTFTPTITPRGTIRLEVAPEVSALDYANGLSFQGFIVPGLSVRRVRTEVEVENNQSFAIAGLLDNRLTENLSKVPGLGDIPLFGKLFQSRATSRNNSELMVVVTPELVQPIAAGASKPTVENPKPFLKDAPAALPVLNPPDTRPLPKFDEIPFVPAEKPGSAPAAPAAATAAAADAAKALTDSLRQGK